MSLLLPDNRLSAPLPELFAQVPPDWRDLTDAFAGDLVVRKVELSDGEGFGALGLEARVLGHPVRDCVKGPPQT